MPGFAAGIAEILRGQFEDEVEFVAMDDPSMMSALTPMPDTSCVILAVMKGIEVERLITPLITYFEGGGGAIGFQGCLVMNSVDDLARKVFPSFGNGTGSPTIKAGIPVNEYVRDERMEGFENLPDGFDLLGQFFTYSANASRAPIKSEPKEGVKTVLFRDKKTTAPLIIAYENDQGSRSVSYAGLFVRPGETMKNYYGNLLDEPLFVALLTDSVGWIQKGTTRWSTHGPIYQELIQTEKDRVERLRDQAERAAFERKRQRTLFLVASWILGLVAIVGLVYLGFFRGTER